MGDGDRADGRWRAALQELLAEPRQPAVAVQPIVDLALGTVAGYEALARFDGCSPPGPPAGTAAGHPTTEQWFAQARRHGLTARLEARCVERALELRDQLPPRCFLTVNCSPDVLGSPELTAAFDAAPDLTGVVVELTEQVDLRVSASVQRQVQDLRRRGATIAVDDYGSGYAGLTQLLAVRPQMVKLDRELVRGVDTDPARQAAVELVGAFLDRIDAWLVAEGVEQVAELDTIARLGVPLAQGYALGHPAPPFAVLDLAVVERLRALGAPGAQAGTVEQVLAAGDVTPSPEGPDRPAAPWVETDPLGCPAALHLPGSAAPHRASRVLPSHDALQVHARTPVVDAALRAMTRPPGRQFEPLVCVDDTGRYLGLVHLDALVRALARAAVLPPLLEALP